MLNIVTGPAASGRDKTFLDMIENAVDSGKRVLVIVPDQYSFECDKKLYERLGTKRFNSIETKGFNRLAKDITERYAGNEAENANEQLKLIIMYKAITKVKAEKNIKYYKRALDKGSFIGEALQLIRDLSRSGITPEDLHVASEKTFGSLSRKLFDLSELYGAYIKELGAAGLKDDRTAMAEAVSYAEKSGFFEGLSLFVDAFTDFSYDEYKLLECMITQAEDMTVALPLSEGGSGALYYPFAVTIRTRRRLRQIAADHNVKTTETACNELYGAACSLLALNKALCGADAAADGSDGGIKLVSSNDAYDSSEYICSEIIRLTREEHYSLNDIAVVSRTLESSAPVLEGTLERYGIPYFSDLSKKADESVIAIYIKSIFECVITESFRTSAIMRYIKSPLCKLYDYDITEIEDFCYTWSVKGDMWKQEFISHDEKNKVSTRLEEIRKQIIEPLERFKNACTDADCADICKALFALLDEIDISSQVYSVIKRGAGDASRTETELAREYKQLWSGIIGAVVTISEAIGEERMSLKQFYELFKLMISQMKLSQPPQKLQCVRCGRAESSRLDNVRVLFVMDANDGVFPADVRSDGLFTEREKQQLEALKLELESSATAFVEAEKLVLYSALTMPTDRAYIISTLVGSDGRKAVPSKFIGFIEKNVKDIEHIDVSKLPIDFFCTSYRSAYYKFLEHSKEKLAIMRSPEDADPDKEEFNISKMKAADNVASLEAALSTNEEYRQKI
ncbi:MAG: ATP-dependent nuclease subunit B, partial [Ruminococcus sp.]|nr:ATP-dependent nuclease subunit B [Ruminococcus sp.]